MVKLKDYFLHAKLLKPLTYIKLTTKKTKVLLFTVLLKLCIFKHVFVPFICPFFYEIQFKKKSYSP